MTDAKEILDDSMEFPRESSQKTESQSQTTQAYGWGGLPPLPPNPWDIERRVSLLEQSTKSIKEELGKINTNISKLVWIVLTAVILAVLNVIVNDHFHI